MKIMISAVGDLNTGKIVSAEYAEISEEVVAKFMYDHMMELKEKAAARARSKDDEAG